MHSILTIMVACAAAFSLHDTAPTCQPRPSWLDIAGVISQVEANEEGLHEGTVENSVLTDRLLRVVLEIKANSLVEWRDPLKRLAGSLAETPYGSTAEEILHTLRTLGVPEEYFRAMVDGHVENPHLAAYAVRALALFPRAELHVLEEWATSKFREEAAPGSYAWQGVYSVRLARSVAARIDRHPDPEARVEALVDMVAEHWMGFGCPDSPDFTWWLGRRYAQERLWQLSAQVPEIAGEATSRYVPRLNREKPDPSPEGVRIAEVRRASFQRQIAQHLHPSARAVWLQTTTVDLNTCYH